MGPITAVDYVPVRSELMNARWPPLIILDPRMYLHTLPFVRTYSVQSPFHLSCSPTSKTSSAWDITFHSTSRYKHMGQRGPCTSLSFIHHLLQKISSHDQQYSSPIFFARSSITSSMARSPRNRIPGLRRPMFSFISPAAETQASPFTLARISDMHPRNGKLVLVRSPARNVPNSRLPVNPVRPAMTLPGVFLRIVESYPHSPFQHATPVNGFRRKNCRWADLSFDSPPCGYDCS